MSDHKKRVRARGPELERCPFDGGIALIERTVCDFKIRCVMCGATIIRRRENEPYVINAWNKRIRAIGERQ